MKIRPYLLFALLALLITSFSTPQAKVIADTVSAKTVLGYYNVYYSGDKNSYQSLTSYGSYLTRISTMTYSVDLTGKVVGTTPTDAVSYANSNHIDAFAAFTNQLNGGGFDQNLAHTILSDATIRQAAIDNIVATVKNNGFKGANVDFENMLAADRSLYSQFIGDLRAKLNANGYQLIVSVMAKTTDCITCSWSGTFDYTALGQAADYIQIMTYDQNGPWGTPGPVAGADWVENVLKYAVSKIDSSKILMGLPAYGYDWNTTNSTGKAVPWKALPNLISTTGSTPKWDSVAQSPTFTYKASDGSDHTVWYENAESIKIKSNFANTYNLAGVSVWCLRLDDENFWKAVHEGLQSTAPTPVSTETITTLTTSKNTYRPGETVIITSKVTNASSQPLAGASVTLTITAPTGKVTTYAGVTDTAGIKKFSVSTTKKSTRGTYKATIVTKLANYQNSTSTISYVLQ